MRRKIIFTLMILFAMRASVAHAHGVVGDYIFLEPLITQDPAPANEFDILGPSWVKSSDGNDYSISSSIEKVLWIDENYMPRFSIGGGSFWQHQSPFHGQNRDGFSNLTMFAKWAFFYSQKHEFLASIGAQIQVPVGNTGIQPSSHTSLGPTFLWEKGMGDLPNWPVLKYLRPLGRLMMPPPSLSR